MTEGEAFSRRDKWACAAACTSAMRVSSFFFLLTRSIMKGKLDYFRGRCYARLGGRRVKDPHHSCGGDVCLFFAISHHSFSRRQCSVIFPVSADAPQRTIVKQDPLAV
jgi:hypothetical protein